MPLQFPTSRDRWSFDLVSLLAVIGESSMSRHVQPLTASRLCLLPRLLPAPQALLKPSRPSGLPSQNAIIVGVYSGNVVHQLNYFANLLHPITELAPYTVREINITYQRLRHSKSGRSGSVLRPILPTNISPLNVLTVFSMLLTLGLLFWAVHLEDGVAFVAILTIAATSSIVGLALLWQPQLRKRAAASRVPPGDVVIITRPGAFLIIHCAEDIARELYIEAEECSYTIGSRLFPALMGLGMLLLMMAVALLGNCTWTMQLALGVSYIILNGLYWAAALLPSRWHWDLERYHVESRSEVVLGSYTEALWQAIKAAGRGGNDEKRRRGRYSAAWVQTSIAAPRTPAWNNWIREAEENVNMGHEEWNAVAAWQELQKEEDVENEVEHAGVTRRPARGTVGDIALD